MNRRDYLFSAEPPSTPWIVMAIFWGLCLWAGVQWMDGHDAEKAAYLADKRAAQKLADQLDHRDRSASEFCKSTHGKHAVFQWGYDYAGNDELNCFATKNEAKK